SQVLHSFSTRRSSDLGYALIDVLLKYTTSLGLQFAVALNLMFVCALIISMVYLLLKYKSLGSMQNIGAGLLLGVLNFANIAFYRSEEHTSELRHVKIS